MEDPTPFLVQHSEGTRQRANLIAADDLIGGKAGKSWSYLIAERGHFVDRYESYGVREPLGGRAPSGSVLVLVVGARSGQISDEGSGGPYPDLAKLGPVHTDVRRSKARLPNGHATTKSEHRHGRLAMGELSASTLKWSRRPCFTHGSL